MLLALWLYSLFCYQQLAIDPPPGFSDTFRILDINWLQAILVHNELLDPRECRYMLTVSHYDRKSDWQTITSRSRELADAPYSEMVYLFPSIDVINQRLMFNRKYREYIENGLSITPLSDIRAIWQEILREVDKCYHIYDLIRDAQRRWYYITVRRKALKELVELLDPLDFDPPFVPYWAFAEK